MINILPKIEQFVTEFSELGVKSKREFLLLQRRFSKTHKTPFFHKDELLATYRTLVARNNIAQNREIEKILRLKETRSLSGIVVVSVLTKPYDCPGQCIYCPDQNNVPKSYLAEEPAVMRAITCKYDPSAQVTSRLTALENIGHSTNKINIRIIGGTWSHYPKQYQTWFIKECFNACNIYAKKSGGNHHTLYELQEINQSANQKIVEISIETRQDFITKNEILHLRKLGVTKVELGVQSLYEKVLRFNKRGHSLKATKKATALLKQAGFKISYQMMLNLPQSDSRKDVAMFGKLFSDPAYKPDFLKIYPLALVKEAPVYKLYLDKKFKPYNEKKLIEIIKKIKKLVPYYCRIERIIRDIPSQYIVEGGSKISNLRQTICAELENENTPCRCIRCREIRNQKQDKNIKMFRQDYDSSGGKEIFLSYESKDRQRLYSILRLRFDQKPIFPFLTNAAMIREIHTYGEQIPLGETSQHAIQHKGLGKELLKEAEKIARHEFETKKIAVIAGVGVRNYFVKQGYRLNNTYMVKRLTR